ncbi:hypothetical protein ABZS99_30130 [Streptomyces sp. NPDC005463]|uniref:hypothetical protein n=1 Tax=Streptomyces sp. NPDC005463 TaxID=3154465 RepID=UPI0033B1DB34
MADEPLGMRPGEDDGTDARISVDPVHQLVQLVGDVEAEHLVRAAVDLDDEDGSAIFDLEMALVYGMDSAPVLSSWGEWELHGGQPRTRVAAMR